ncbi:MMS19 nucleotide excision repair protein isoform X1 [Danaus plexippus]|uniref:MMS19 nucleotide excision repair protein isoform X1 n=2 Tax=Danaus plexippus TaxID=13037 RepID=UPI002AAFA0A5|nr:MMS19 nucleotide excision repair protein isoform X1 [Danaus plexippus]
MEAIWYKSELADEIIKNNDIFNQTQSIIADVVSGKLDITVLVENMAGVLTSKEVEDRERGMRFFTKILKEIPADYLTEMQIKFISKFYVDRLKDNHRVIPAVLEGYLSVIDMKHYNVQSSGEYLTALFREVACQSQVRQDRYNIYLTIQKLFGKNVEYMKTLGPDFVYGFISSMDGERDPRNLLFLFNFLPNFLSNIPLGHLVEEMFEVISCYYPIDFHPSPDDPAAVSRNDLAAVLCPCLCAIPEFAEHCLVLLIEKLDSNLRVAKIDSLMLLAASCKTFKYESYGPFLKALWSSLQRELTHKTDDELKLAAHEALSALVSKLSTKAETDQSFENFIKGILISMQSAIAESSTVIQFMEAVKILLTAANASKQSCVLIIKAMIPAILAYYEFKPLVKLQISCLDVLGDMYELADHWGLLDEMEKEVNEIPQLCLTAVSERVKDYQVSGFKTLIRVKNVLHIDLVLPFVEILIYNIQHSQDSEILSVCVETVHAIARKYPELIMTLVVKGKCDLENLTQDKTALQKRLDLLSNLASIDDFTKIIIEEMLKVITTNDEEASKVVKALSGSISNVSLYTEEKVAQIESDHGLISSIMAWLTKSILDESHESLNHGCTLISNTICSLPPEKQANILSKHSKAILEKCDSNEMYFLILECLYRSISPTIYDTNFKDIMGLALKLALNCENQLLRTKACCMVAHFLNKAQSGPNFEILNEVLKSYLTSCSRDNVNILPRLIELYGWITKALIMRGNDLFQFWLSKILISISTSECSVEASEAIKIIMTDSENCLNARHHCRTSLLYRQRMFQTFVNLTEKLGPPNSDSEEAFYLSWGYVLEKTPKSILNSQINKVTPLVIDALVYDNKELLKVMLEVLIHFVQSKNITVGHSLQTILPRLINLTTYVKCMDVRIKSLQCLYEIANSYQTRLLLPHKQDILIDLAPSLDDKKRLVRNMAVKARTRWYLVGAPGESKED